MLPLLLLAGTVLLFHAAFDRLLGYGLKYGSSFHDTHLKRTGPAVRHAEKHPPTPVGASSTVAAR